MRFEAAYCRSDIPILSEWQRDKENFFYEKRQFCDFNWLPWQRPLSYCQNGA